MTSARDILNMIESLAIVIQDSAETGHLDASLYADMADLMGYLAALAKSMIDE